MARRYRSVAITSFVLLVGALVFFSFFSPIFVPKGTTKTSASLQLFFAPNYYDAKFAGYLEDEYELKLRFDALIKKYMASDKYNTFAEALRAAEKYLGSFYPTGNGFNLVITFEQITKKQLFRKAKETIDMYLWLKENNTSDPLVKFQFPADTDQFTSAQVTLDNNNGLFDYISSDVRSVAMSFTVRQDKSLAGEMTGYTENGKQTYTSKVILIREATAQALTTTRAVYRAPFSAILRRATTPTTPTRPTAPTRITLPTRPTIPTRKWPPWWPTKPRRPTTD